ncbi:MAG: Crp/Fnr family transcriptional regulator [Rhodoferax sp.]|nr:Crp/Fnr family transcriptional regulator [Betaproteobacteria bacterium]NCN98039.1 Crp/Fnr family transcriptional regulator [Rhodoferax sp.]OIP19935.1 MAG: Crp/Fnr family transcriptional regulator [Comamonadaceae bacterium CG2_30_57_122]PIZ22757.1 MAG: Crp/Fnr family transcriptional regulator [Comamonadaceae bacterium CG_4_10_14_0_8_um_filter_57_29]PJC16818.1 MAG: Crp/Fnr family transcriptional regulator [Comamonadaceae bacterium CG_4_9_14_0_8_um_filter_57_21]
MNALQLDVGQLLAALPLFSALSPHERERIAQGCQLKQVSRGGVLFRTGDACEAFYVVVSGQIRLFVASPSGQEKVIEIIGPGHSFAEAMVFLGQPHIVNAQALADTLLVCVCKQAVFGEVERDPRFALRMLAGISRRLHGLIQDVESYALHSGMQRLIGYLLREVETTAAQGSPEAGVTITLPASKATIASRLSLTPEYFSHVLHELEAQGLIQIDKRDIRIQDVKQLACFGSH